MTTIPVGTDLAALALMAPGPRAGRRDAWDADVGCWRAVVARAEARKLGLTQYFTGKACPHGHTSERKVSGRNCLVCKRERDRDYRERNPEQCRERDRDYRERNREQCRERNRNWRERNREYCIEYNRDHRERNPEYHREYRRDYNKRNREYHREYKRDQYATDTLFQMECKSRSALGHAKQQLGLGKLEGQMRHFNFAVADLYDRLQASIWDFYNIYPKNQWPARMPGTVIQAFSDGWDIDHIIPLAEFKARLPEDATEAEKFRMFQAAHRLDNLRLLPAHINRSEGARKVNDKTWEAFMAKEDGPEGG